MKPLLSAKLSFASETEDEDRDERDPGSGHDDHEEEELSRSAGYTHVSGTPDPPPLKLPEFSLSELRAAVPKHCFERSLATAMSYLGRDLFIVSVLFFVAYHFHNSAPSTLLQVMFWPGYWLFQGTYLTGVWIIGHECGHQAFSEYGNVNDFVGMVLHSALLTPYFSWEITHRHHHSSINSMEHDAEFIPMTRTEYKTWREAVDDILEDTPLFNLYRVFVVPYIVMNAYITIITLLQHTDTFIPRF